MSAATTRSTMREAVEGHGRPGDFRHRAACRSVDPDVFFPAAVAGHEYERQVAVAKAVCAGCPVLAECLTWALSALSDGIAGGMTEDERRVEQARRRGDRRRGGRLPRPRPPRRPTGGTRAEIAAAGRAAIAAGLSPQEAAQEFRVTPRTAGRWARAVQTSTRRTSAMSGSSGGKGAPAATGAPFQISHTDTQAGTRAEGNRS